VEAVGGNGSHGAARSALSPSQRQENVWPGLCRNELGEEDCAEKRKAGEAAKHLALETVVDEIEEAVPGVITVTEFEETEVREPSKGPKEAEENGSPQGDESQ
jgi:hypothetical protein